MSKTIEIIVDPKGASQIETKGFTGSDCQQASKFLEQALGERRSEELTAEYHGTSIECRSDVRQTSP